jgi:hypothetical protein
VYAVRLLQGLILLSVPVMFFLKGSEPKNAS